MEICNSVNIFKVEIDIIIVIFDSLSLGYHQLIIQKLKFQQNWLEKSEVSNQEGTPQKGIEQKLNLMEKSQD